MVEYSMEEKCGAQGGLSVARASTTAPGRGAGSVMCVQKLVEHMAVLRGGEHRPRCAVLLEAEKKWWRCRRKPVWSLGGPRWRRQAGALSVPRDRCGRRRRWMRLPGSSGGEEGLDAACGVEPRVRAQQRAACPRRGVLGASRGERGPALPWTCLSQFVVLELCAVRCALAETFLRWELEWFREPGRAAPVE
jgi:hypothetical protein